MSQTPPDAFGEPDHTQPVQANPAPGSAIPPASSPYSSWSEQPTAPHVDLTKAEPAWSQPPAPSVPSAPYGEPSVHGQQPRAGHVPDHPQATTVLVLGILGIVLCSVLSPFAWAMGNRVVGEIDASQGQLGGRSSANAGKVCGIIGSVLLGLGLLAVVGFFLLFAVGVAGLAGTAP